MIGGFAYPDLMKEDVRRLIDTIQGLTASIKTHSRESNKTQKYLLFLTIILAFSAFADMILILTKFSLRFAFLFLAFVTTCLYVALYFLMREEKKEL